MERIITVPDLAVFLLYAVPVVLAITAHEAAHGYVAAKLGDRTALHNGRVTLNPLPHLDPVGTLLVPILIFILSGGKAVFGWAKSVPMNFGALREPWHVALVAGAGPLANALMCGLWWALEPWAGDVARAGVLVNAALGLVNLLPVLPLDGGRILMALLPARLAWRYGRSEAWGLPVLVSAVIAGSVAARFI